MVWKALNTEHQKLFPTTPKRTNADIALLNASNVAPNLQREPASLIEEALAPSALIFGRRPDSLSGRKPSVKSAIPEPASLF